MNTTVAWAILTTLAYADVFSFPLTDREICHYLVSTKRWRGKVIRETLVTLEKQNLVQRLRGQKAYFLLSGREGVNRKLRQRTSLRKLRNVKSALRLLCFIPTVLLVGISGGVARGNASVHDDVDLFIITRSKTLWLTRLVSLLILDLLRVRRKPGEKKVANKLCLNMLVDQSHLVVPFGERDLFSAYEVVQMKPMFVRENTYQEFLQANSWVREFLANMVVGSRGKVVGVVGKDKESVSFSFSLLLATFYLLEPLAKYLQLKYMRQRQTSEIISDGYVRFHPHDARSWILKRYRWRLGWLRKKFAKIKTNRVSHLWLFSDFPKSPVPHD